MQTAASLLFLLVFATGCEHSAKFTFQIVDAKTGVGLESVKLEAPLSGDHLGFHAFPADDDPVLIAKSDTNGLVTLDLKFEKSLNYYLFLTKPGYEAITGQIYPFTGKTELKRRPSDTLPALGLSQDMPEIHMAVDRVTIFPMYPLAATTQHK